MQHKVAILIPYFGAWPRWFDLFLETCRRNPEFNWIFLTDIPAPEHSPANVAYHPYSLEAVGRRAEERLGQPVNIAYPFKVCDFRPAFGHLFESYVEGYDFWGWGDIDVFYGRMADFLTDEIFARNDVISCREGFLAGELTLLRNSEQVNDLYRRSRDHQMVFAERGSFNFSEKGFFENKEVDSITHVVRRAEQAGELHTHLHAVIRTDRKLKGKPFRFFWKDGELTDLRAWEPILMYHFLDNKKRKDYAFAASPEDPDGWLMDQSGVFPAPEGFVPRRQLGPMLSHRARRSLRRLRRKLKP